jgi:hypothetical protein
MGSDRRNNKMERRESVKRRRKREEKGKNLKSEQNALKR